MTTLKQLVDEYNKRATSAGVPTLKGWKGSKEKLVAKLGELEHEVLTVVEIAEELDMNPKVARGRLRRAGLKAVDRRWPTVKRHSSEYNRIVGALVSEEQLAKLVKDATD